MRNAKLPYRIVRPLARIALTTNFRRIYLSNAQVMSRDKPVILAANHPSAFLEPCILAVLLPRPLHFLVRGDFFKKPLFSKILHALHMLPIFRMKDGGYKKIKDNFSTFEQCHQTLANDRVIMILAEGTTVHEKRLRPLRKGTARLAFGTLEKFPDLDIDIIPVGVNYTNSDQFRSHVMIEFGQPISAQSYFKQYKKEPNQAIKQLTDDLRKDLEKHIVIIENKADEELTEGLFAIDFNNWPQPPQPAVSKNNHLLKSQKRIARAINQMNEADKKVLKIKTDAYFQNLKKLNVHDYAIAVGNVPGPQNLLVIILGFFPFLIGWIGNYLPLKLTDVLINRLIKAIEFRASVKVATAIVLYILYFLFIIIIAIIAGKYSLLFVLLTLPFFGYYALLYREYFQKWSRLRALKKLEKTDINNLKEMREGLLSSF